MSTTEEAVTPQLPFDAPVTPPEVKPDGDSPKAGNEADSSPAAKKDASDTPDPEAKWVQRRIDELTRQRHEAERRERDARKDLEFYREQALKAQPAPEPEGPKSLADFQFNDGQYQQYLFSKAADAARKAAKEELAQEQSAAEKQRQAGEYATKVREFAKDHPDYRDVAEYAPISNQVADIILGLDSGPELAYHLGKNPDVAIQISNLPAPRAAYELGQISARLSIEREAAAKAKKLVSGAPPPSPRIEGTEPAVTPKASDPESDKIPMDQWLKMRNKEVKKRRS